MKKIVTILLFVFLSLAIYGQGEKETQKKSKRAPRPAFGSYQEFETVEAKDEYLLDVFTTLGKKQGRLLASTAVRYQWELEKIFIFVTDTTGVDGKPSVNLMIRRKPNKAIDHDKK